MIRGARPPLSASPVLSGNYSKNTKIVQIFFRGSMPRTPQSHSCFSMSFQFLLPKKIRLKTWKLWPLSPFDISRYATAGVRLIAIEEIQNYRKFYTLKTFLKMAGGRVHTSHPSPTPVDPPLSPDHKL